MSQVYMLWCSATDWQVRMLGEKGRGIRMSRSVIRRDLVGVDWRPLQIQWPGDPSTAAECLAMAESVWAEQFGETK